MLAYLNTPKGYAVCDGKRIHGYTEEFPPIHLKWATFKNNENTLVEAPFTSSYLTKVFNKIFEHDIRFTISELKFMNYSTLQKIASFLDLNAKSPRDTLVYNLNMHLKDV